MSARIPSNSSFTKKKNENEHAKNLNRNFPVKINDMNISIDYNDANEEAQQTHSTSKLKEYKRHNYNTRKKTINNNISENVLTEEIDDEHLGNVEYTKNLIKYLKEAMDENDKVKYFILNYVYLKIHFLTNIKSLLIFRNYY